MSDHVYPMCPECQRADVAVRMARDEGAPCPYCGGALFATLRTCALPDCTKKLPTTRELPVCRDCGIKIAVFHAHDADLWHAVQVERRRQSDLRAEARRNGTNDGCAVYYVRLGPERIKIGFTSNLKGRLSALRVHPSALLAWEPGGRDVEGLRHRQFASERITSRLEDFQDSPRLLDWIDNLKAQYALPRFALLPDTSTVTTRRA